MTILEHSTFKNLHDDKVDVRLLHNDGTYEVIVNVEMNRRTIEKRFHENKIVELSVYKFTHEVTMTKTTVERTAVVEYNMSRAMNSDPDYSMCDFQEWLRSSDPRKQEQ